MKENKESDIIKERARESATEEAKRKIQQRIDEGSIGIKLVDVIMNNSVQTYMLEMKERLMEE